MGNVIPLFRAPRYGGVPCAIKLTLPLLTPKSQKLLISKLEDPSISIREIVEWLAANNIHIGHATLGKHRRRDCQTCNREAA